MTYAATFRIYGKASAWQVSGMLCSTLFAVTIGLAAIQIFLLEAIIGKQLLPFAGGGPMIWNTCLVFFQLALFISYLAAFLLVRLVSDTIQRLFAVGIIIVAVGGPGFLRDGITSLPPLGASPEMWLWGWLCIAVTLPFCSVAILSPLLQHWFARLAESNNPYPLYAASNLGSFIGILIYPLYVESEFSLTAQRSVAMVLALVIATLVVTVALYRPKTSQHDAVQSTSSGKVGGKLVLWWILLAALPSSLLLSVTNFILTDIVAVPLFWMVPLLIYLATFIVAFALPDGLPASSFGRVGAFLALPLTITFLLEANSPAVALIPLHLIAFGVLALYCHTLLAQSRPLSSKSLTTFYLWISFGGVIGGLVTLLLCPLIFERQVEYILGILAIIGIRAVPTPARLSIRFFIAGALVVLLVIVGRHLAQNFLIAEENLKYLILFGPAAAIVLHHIARPKYYAGLFAVLVMIGLLQPSHLGTTLDAQRNFFGLVRVTDGNSFHLIVHGSTIHGMQHKASMSECIPTAYYHPSGPLGDAFLWPANSSRSVLVIGLGVGSMVCFAHPLDRWTFYELNPAMERIARNEALFSYLANSPADNLQLQIGDGRRLLSADTEARFDILVVDAFSSDSIPTHLLTREAFELYVARLNPGGRILVHITNRYFDLKPVLARLAATLGLHAWVREELTIAPELGAQGKTPSTWVWIEPASDGQPKEPPTSNWHRLMPDQYTKLWTDEYSNPVAAIRIRDR